MKHETHEYMSVDIADIVDNYHELSMREDLKTPKREQKLTVMLHMALIINQQISEHCKDQVNHMEKT